MIRNLNIYIFEFRIRIPAARAAQNLQSFILKHIHSYVGRAHDDALRDRPGAPLGHSGHHIGHWSGKTQPFWLT